MGNDEKWSGCDKLKELKCEWPTCSCKAMSEKNKPEFGLIKLASNMDVLLKQGFNKNISISKS